MYKYIYWLSVVARERIGNKIRDRIRYRIREGFEDGEWPYSVRTGE